MKPPADRAQEGRVNPKGIPCLYLATMRETAISEVRPWLGTLVSVAQFRTTRPLRIVDCSVHHARQPLFLEEPSEADREQAVWAHIDRAFSEPTTRSDDTADYVATQILAELFRREGYDGVAYKSAFGEQGFNIALFDLEAAELLNCGLYKIDSLNYRFSEADNPYFVTKAK
jgi:RES domain-containing protein